MSLIEKFKKDVSTLRSAANGDIYLDVKSPKLYKKVRRYYENNGVVFSGALSLVPCPLSLKAQPTISPQGKTTVLRVFPEVL